MQERLRWGSFTLFVLTLASWVLALGGISALNWMACSDTEATRTGLATASGQFAQYVYIVMGVPAVGTDVAVCSRWRAWEWWTLFFQLGVIVYGLVSTLLPNRLPRARYAISQYLVIASVLIMIALNKNIVQLWLFWDQRPMFTSWTGVARKFYMSAAATCAGWILTVIFNLVFIGFSLDYEVKPEQKPQATATADVEAPQAPKK